MDAAAAGEIFGFNQCKNGTMNRDVCWADIRSVESRKIRLSQINKGSQYLKRDFIEPSDNSFALDVLQFTMS
jgi:hypothetical protein